MSQNKILITGVYGLIGNIVYALLSKKPDEYDIYGLARRRVPSERLHEDRLFEIPDEKFHLVDIKNFSDVQKALSGMDTVVHLAADSSGKSWESVLNNNIVGTYNIFEASRLAGVKRVVYASTIQVIFGYCSDEPYKSLFEDTYINLSPAQISPIAYNQPTRPMNFYASSKIWGEAMAHVYAKNYDMSFICLRIGSVLPDDKPLNRFSSSIWCSQRDIIQLIERCINAPESVKFDVFFGLSDNRYMLADIQHTKEILGYEPQDHAEDFLKVK
jgi:nucleoside-diphosphate-sugar epimerase